MLFRQAQIDDLEAIWQIILYARKASDKEEANSGKMVIPLGKL